MTDFTTQARALVAANDRRAWRRALWRILRRDVYHQPARALLNRTDLGSHHAV
jgi:hypothetical protein